jgi:hypothetical protein
MDTDATTTLTNPDIEKELSAAPMTQLWLRRKDWMACVVGLGTFAVGLVLIVISLVLMGSNACHKEEVRSNDPML